MKDLHTHVFFCNYLSLELHDLPLIFYTLVKFNDVRIHLYICTDILFYVIYKTWAYAFHMITKPGT